MRERGNLESPPMSDRQQLEYTRQVIARLQRTHARGRRRGEDYSFNSSMAFAVLGRLRRRIHERYRQAGDPFHLLVCESLSIAMAQAHECEFIFRNIPEGEWRPKEWDPEGSALYAARVALDLTDYALPPEGVAGREPRQ